MSELLYDINSELIAVALFISMAIAAEIGYRIGTRSRANTGNATKEHINGIQSSILGILAVLLGFTFSLSLQRFDSRSEALVDEANAIGTAYLRLQLLPETQRKDVQLLMHHYVDARVEANATPYGDRSQLETSLVKATRIQTELWSAARRGIETDSNIYAPALFVESVNELIDSYGRRVAALNRHVPEVALLLLYGTFLMSGAIVGFASGVSGHRPSMVSYLMVALIVILVFIIIDLDRPRRGLIQVSQNSLVELQTTIHAETNAAR